MARKKNKLSVEINLLPPEYRKAKRDLSWVFDRRIVWPMVALLVLLVGLFMALLQMNDTISTLEIKIKSTQAEVEKEKPLLQKIGELDKKLLAIAQKNTALKSIQVSKKRWVILFENISSVLPPNMWLVNLNQLSANEMELKGFTYDFSEVAEYMVKLEKQVSISAVSLITIATTKTGGEDSYSFTIKASIKKDLGLEGAD
ncbi:MAG: PilN domain-containing protein [Fibrobacter sp.]|jgi:type IV pilus assembly protein PilN|nr:PilN domain-containing protein [Fibrobacter sp.]